MPALPLLYRRIEAAAAAAQDRRILDARQLGLSLRRAAEVARDELLHLARRAPAIIPAHNNPSTTPTTSAPITRRQDASACTSGFISACYQGLNAGPAPGAVVGIILGAVLGFLLLLYLLYTLSNGGGFIRTSNLQEEDVYVNHHAHPRRRRRSSDRSEMRQSAPVAAAAAPRRDRVVRQERISREVPRETSRSRVRETIIVDDPPTRERRVDGDDVIEVIAEESDVTASAAPPPRRKSGRRSSGYR